MKKKKNTNGNKPIKTKIINMQRKNNQHNLQFKKISPKINTAVI